MRNIFRMAIYGKGGIGKSTIASNLAVSFSLLKKSTLLMGCDPKRDTTRNLLSGKLIPTVLDSIQKNNSITLEKVVHRGYNGVFCVESGGPEPGIGCAGRGIILAIETLEKLGLFDQVDTVIFDVLGDVVCGGFAMPIRKGYANYVYIVISGEFMSLYAANNICKGIKRFSDRKGALLGGLIYNSRDVPNGLEISKKFAKKIGTDILGEIPRSNLILKGDIQRKTVFEAFPDSDIVERFKELTHNIMKSSPTTPKPLSYEELEDLAIQTLL
ncbi:MAG: ArsA-related P-loop ATPase [Candidatus Hydrothermarchaeota archaeon]